MRLSWIITKQKALALFKSDAVNIVSGSFDLLHAGHIHFLKQAKINSGNIPLLAIILDDENVRRRKGLSRPIIPLDQRLMLLESIRYIDYILPWYEDWEEIRSFVSLIKIDTLFLNKKDPGIKNKQEIAKNNSFKSLFIKAYNEISTSQIIKKIITNAKEC